MRLRRIMVYLNILLRRDWRKSQDSRYLKGVWRGYMCRLIVVWIVSKQRNIKYIPQLMGYANNIGDIWNLLKTKGFSPLQNIQTGPRTHTAWYSVGVGILFPWQSGQGANLTAHLHRLQRLRMSGVLTLLPIYALMAWTETNVYFLL